MTDREVFEVVDNIVDLPELEESHIVRNLRERYRIEKIYTNVGNILIAINPYQAINIYGLDMVTKYHKAASTLPPHLFCQGNEAYRHMKDEKEDQVVVISGESGSGKTESTKLLMHFLAKISNKSGKSTVTEQILEANPILESFGNARTVINDNSSRFGKYVLLYFANGAMVGSKTNKYLLERSRIVKQLPGERNYHFFYEMFRGLPSNIKSKLHLSKIEDFAYLNHGRDAIIDSRDDLANFNNVQRAFQHHKFTDEEMNGTFKILSAVLHLGNVTFMQTESAHGMEGVSLATESNCRIVGELLKVPFEGLKRVLTKRITEARNEKMIIPLTKDQAIDVRDSIAKALYHHIFNWLVKKINSNSKHDSNLDNLNSIAILDIFGFEDLMFNSFEQLCINYANESLQYYFNKHIFKIEQEEYAKEGVTWYTIDFQDNQPVVDLIAKKPHGIFHLLDEESYFPNGSDLSFLEKCHNKHGSNNHYAKPRMADPEFSIKHYAGLVTYNVVNFLDKNRESLKTEVLLFLLESEDAFVSDFFGQDLELRNRDELLKNGTRSTMSTKARSGTVSSLFHDSLQSLLEMMKCNPWFIRCIKPNNTKHSMLFQDHLVLNQLRATGMLETVKIRKLGFCVRQKFFIFYQKFRSLLPPTMSSPLNVTEANLHFICQSILENQAQVWKNSWEIGKTKVFMREDFLGHLVKAKSKFLVKAALVFQKYARGWLAREQLLRNKRAILRLQASMRGWIARKNYNKIVDAAVAIQAQIRRLISQKGYKKMEEDRSRVCEVNQKQMKKFEDDMKARRSKIFEEIKAQGPLPDEVLKEKISFKVNANSLEIPRALAYQISEHPGSIEDAFVQVPHVAQTIFSPQLPFDVDSFDFKKYAEVYCPGTMACIPKGFHENPILAKASEKDAKTTLELAKLLLRYLIKDNDSLVTQMLSVNFIISKCLNTLPLKDEILLQICSKAFMKDKLKASMVDRIWFMMTLCGGCFHPSQVLSNYLINYVSHYCPETLAPYCQNNLLRGLNVPEEINRSHPPCKLEWMALFRRLPMALTASFYDGTKICREVDSWTTAEEFMDELFQERKLDDSGWSLELVDGNVCCFLSGSDFVLDGIKEVETEEKYLTTDSHLLAYKVGSNRTASNLEKLLTWKEIDMSEIVELKEFAPAPPRLPVHPSLFFKFSNRRDSIYAKNANKPLKSFDKIYADLGLSERSPLNERFVKCLESEDRGQLQQLDHPSNSLLDLTRINPKCLKRIYVDIELSQTDKSPQQAKPLENGANYKDSQDVSMSDWVENVFKPAFNDDNGLHYMNAQEIAKMLKGVGDNEKPAAMYRPALGSIPLPPSVNNPDARRSPIPRPQFILAKNQLQDLPVLGPALRRVPQPKKEASPMRRQGNTITTDINYQGHSNKTVNFAAITEDDIEDDREYFDLSTLLTSDTQLHVRSSQSHLTYGKVLWSLRARKEIFTRNEPNSNELVNEFIYLQIISDLDKKCIRISQEDENTLKSKMGCRDLDFVTKKNHNPREKATILEVAKQWPNYFSRIYKVSGGSLLTSVQYLGISHSGVRFLAKVDQGGRERFDVIERISYEEIIDICVPQPRSLQFHYKLDKYAVLYFDQATRAQNLIEAFCIELEQNSVFVKAIQNYPTNENELLSFAKGDIIKLTNRNQELEQGWLYGAVHGKVGMFPAEFAIPMAIHQVPLSFKTFEVNTTLPDFSLYNTLKEPSYSSFEEAKQHYVMLEYASKYFRKNVSMSSILKKDLKKIREVWSGQEFLERVKWSKAPIKDSLTNITSDTLNKIAVNIFKSIMEYMHDYPLTKGKSSHSSVSVIFSHCYDHPELRNETYCQILKQLTANKSPKSDSCQQGWRLLLMFCSFFDCDDILRPYVLAFIEEVARDQNNPDCKLAEKCLHNLKQTIRYGGRKGTLEKTEISSITLGRYTRQIICTIPGNSMTRIFAETSMVVKDAVEQICENFDIGGSSESSEYIIYIIHGNERSLFPLDDETYVMDIVSDFAQKERPCQFLFCRFTWVFPLPGRITPSHLNLMFAQSRPDYLDGLLVPPPPKNMNETKEMILKLSFFLMKSENFVDFQNKKGVQRYLPKNVHGHFNNSQELQSKLGQLLKKYKGISSQESQQYFLENLSHLPLFGSTFFILNYVSSQKVSSKCLLGVNKNGLTFLHEKTMENLWIIPLNEVLGVGVREEKRKFVELKHGNLLVQNMSHLFTDNPHPLKLLIEKYTKVFLSFRNSSSSTGSSSSSDKTTNQGLTGTLASTGRAVIF